MREMLVSNDLYRAVNDPVRLSALNETGLLDSPDEEAFDSLTRLVCLNMHSPMSLITLVDKNRQFFKSQAGLNIVEREAPLTYSICQFVVREKAMVVIEDVRSHPFTEDMSALPSMGFMAYCGVPLISDGQVIGSLCGVDSRPRKWTGTQIAALKDLSKVATIQIEAHKLKSKIMSQTND